MCAREAERFPLSGWALSGGALSGCAKDWLDALKLEPATLPAVRELARSSDEGDEGVDGDAIIVRRQPVRRETSDPAALGDRRASLLLQGAAAAAFYSANGFALAPEDLERASFELRDGSALLWLERAPIRRADAADADAASRVAEAVAALLDRLFPRGRRDGNGKGSSGAAAMRQQLRAPEARWKRPEHWIATALRAFPELGGADAAPARARCLGISGEALRSADSRALTRVARALARGEVPRVFRPGRSPLTPGGALSPDGAADAGAAARLLRTRSRESGETVWIAVALEEWDPTSRQAFEALSLEPGRRVERVPRAVPSPKAPADWRQALWIPCGTVAASVRFYERFSECAEPDPARALERARQILRHPDWVRFAADPTGDARIPEALSTGAVHGAGERTVAREPAPEDRGLRIERLLADGRDREAVAEARAWVDAYPEMSVKAWFPLAARLCGQGVTAVPWLEAIEAEREIAGGRAGEARSRLERLLRGSEASPAQRRSARLRLAELASILETPAEAARLAAAWRRAHPPTHTDAAPGEIARALRLGAVGYARAGRFARALALLTRADRLTAAAPLSALERLETALARARVYALAGRVADEEAVYDSVRSGALSSGDDALAVRFLAQEARCLIDRREFGRAILRFEEALACARDDAGERAELLLDVSAALYHAGDAAASEERLRECLAAAGAAGRDDVVRIARGNRLELWIDRGEWDSGAAEIARLEAQARVEKDDPRLLVALHHRSRLALRRGFLEAAASDNAQARRLCERLSDRLEIGELWLEEGDRCAYEGNVDGARAAWTLSAAAPPDRSGRVGWARRRLGELSWNRRPPAEALSEVEALFSTDPYRAAEDVVRWRFLLGESALSSELLDRAARTLRERGGDALADRAFRKTPTDSNASRAALRELRSAISAVLQGGVPDGHRALGALGLAGLSVQDADGGDLVRVGRLAAPDEAAARRPLEAGAARYQLTCWPPRPPETLDAIALLLETLLYRAAPEPPAPISDFAEGWRRLGLVTEDPSMEEPYRRLARFAPQAVTVLILGPSGSGKEAVARAVHRLSPRTSGPFVAVNVPAMPAALLESELFGHARGAFTGADRDRRGLLEEASGGTIFFDEIGDLAPELQAKLLRALQEREIRRVGENRPRAIDVRVVSATSVDLAARVEAGQFREDLFYRLHVGVVRLPPLRERGRDALILARHFLAHFAGEYGRGRLLLMPETAQAILAHGWPGNVRELQNAVSQAAALCDADGAVSLALLPESVRRGLREARRAEPAADGARSYRSRVDAHRRDLIADALDRAGGNRSRAAKELGMSRQALHYLIRELRLAPRP